MKLALSVASPSGLRVEPVLREGSTDNVPELHTETLDVALVERLREVQLDADAQGVTLREGVSVEVMLGERDKLEEAEGHAEGV